MPHSDAQAWWADVQHVRESIERRRAGAADSSALPDAPTERRFVRAAEESLPPLDDLDWTSTVPGRSGGRFVHTDAPARPAPASRARWSDDSDTDDHVDIDAELAALQRERPVRRSEAGDRRDPAPRPDLEARRGRDVRRDPEGRRGRDDRRHPEGRRGPDDRRDPERHRDSEDRRPRDDRPDPQGLREPEDRRATRPRENATAPAAGIALEPPPGRRTVQITGRPGSGPSLARLVEVERRRPPRRPAERVGPRPDRIALWAVLLGFFLILVAATSSNAATHPAQAADQSAVALHAPAR